VNLRNDTAGSDYPGLVASVNNVYVVWMNIGLQNSDIFYARSIDGVTQDSRNNAVGDFLEIRRNSYIDDLTTVQILAYILRCISDGKNENQIADCKADKYLSFKSVK